MSGAKHRWKIEPPPSGAYRGNAPRTWPTAEYPDGRPCAQIVCDDDYHPGHAARGRHKPLSLRIANHAMRPWVWMRSTRTFPNLEAAKAGLADTLARAPSLAPQEYRL